LDFYAMQTRLVATNQDIRIWIVVLDTEDEAVGCLNSFAAAEGLTGASFTAIGAFESCVVGYFDWPEKKYLPVPIDSQAEVLSLAGDIARDESGKPSIHAHVVLGLKDGVTRGGHLMEGRVRPTLEITVTETPAYLRRTKRADLGIALVDLRGDDSKAEPPAGSAREGAASGPLP
jgi:uncharacterized protein